MLGISTSFHRREPEPQSIPETIYQESLTPNLTTKCPTLKHITGNSRRPSPYLKHNVTKSRNRSLSRPSTPISSVGRSFGCSSDRSGLSPESDIESIVSWWFIHSTTMSNSTPNDSSPRPLSSVPEAARNVPGNSFREKMKYLRSRERASIKPLRSISASATPSSAGDIEQALAIWHH